MAFPTDNLEQVIREVGEPIARALGVEILEVQCLGKPTSPLVRLVLDKQNGIGIEDCEQFHQSLRRTWEVSYPEYGMFRFEISSPGLDRPLKNHKDFQRVVGELLRVTLKHPVNKQSIVLGRLINISDSGIRLIDDQGKPPQEICLDWNDIAKARLEVKF